MKRLARLPWLAALVFGVILTLIIAAAVMSFRQQLALFQVMSEQAALTTTVAIAQSLDREAKLGAWLAVQERLRRSTTLALKSHLRVIAADGVVLADSQRIRPEGRLTLPLVRQSLAEKVAVLTAPGDSPATFRVAVPLPDQTGQPGAVLLNEVDWTTQAAEARQNALINILTVVLSTVAIAGAALTLLWVLVVWPLEQLRHLAEAVTGGVEHARVPAFQVVELRQVGAALNRMLDRAEEQRATLEALNANLEGIVARRTAELAASRDSLQRLVQQTPVGIQIFDKRGLCTEVNQMHLDIFGVPNREQLVGRYNIFDDPLAALVGTDAGAKRALAGETVYLDDLTFDFTQAEPRYAANTGQRIISVAFFPIFDENGQVANIVALNQDITERKQAEMEREKLIGELQAAVSKVKTLSGLLPICASCKKIRDDGGYWHQVEAYIRDYSEAEFSHGICPDCMKKLYAEFFEDD